MTLLGRGVHITSPQPIPEAIAWHTVPAQLSALRKQLRDAQNGRQEAYRSLDKRHVELRQHIIAQVEALQQQLEESTDALGQRFDALEQAGQALACAQHDQLGELGAALANTFHQGLDSLDKAQQGRLEFEGVQVLQQVAATALSERLDRLEQPLLKRLWRWLTNPWRKNGKTL